MFTKLRNRFILTNIGITTAILIVAIILIYFLAAGTTHDRPPIPDGAPEYTPTVTNIITERVAYEQRAYLDNLLSTLLATSIVIELIVAIVSYFLAESSIKPIRNAYETQKIFIANASHEIKTPLATITANLEAADVHGNRWIDNASEQVAALTALSNQLVTLTQTDNIARPTKLTDTNLVKLVTKLSEPSRAIMNDRNINFQIVNRLKSPNIKLNKSDFSQIYNILLDNAIKYCDRQITVTITDRQLAITNDGQTIKQTDLPHIFDRFYQTDKSSNGVGLGLAIAKSLADHNHWQLSVASKSTTTFTLTF